MKFTARKRKNRDWDISQGNGFLRERNAEVRSKFQLSKKSIFEMDHAKHKKNSATGTNSPGSGFFAYSTQ